MACVCVALSALWFVADRHRHNCVTEGRQSCSVLPWDDGSVAVAVQTSEPLDPEREAVKRVVESGQHATEASCAIREYPDTTWDCTVFNAASGFHLEVRRLKVTYVHGAWEFVNR